MRGPVKPIIVIEICIYIAPIVHTTRPKKHRLADFRAGRCPGGHRVSSSLCSCPLITLSNTRTSAGTLERLRRLTTSYKSATTLMLLPFRAGHCLSKTHFCFILVHTQAFLGVGWKQCCSLTASHPRSVSSPSTGSAQRQPDRHYS